MVILKDKTCIIENEEEIEALAHKESEDGYKNYYDNNYRTLEEKKRDIYNGKFAEGMVQLYLMNKYNCEFITGVTSMQGSPDDGYDMTIRSKRSNKPVKIQVKSIQSSKWYSIDCLDDLCALQNFDGYIIICDTKKKRYFILDHSRLNLDNVNKDGYLRESNFKGWYIDIGKLREI